uniref:Nuclear RNA export factor 1-like n=1 Tax=Hirondellea gigas TaxID=1518452 RepID=A0A2P2I0S1_9CRUS
MEFPMEPDVKLDATSYESNCIAESSAVNGLDDVPINQWQCEVGKMLRNHFALRLNGTCPLVGDDGSVFDSAVVTALNNKPDKPKISYMQLCKDRLMSKTIGPTKLAQLKCTISEKLKKLSHNTSAASNTATGWRKVTIHNAAEHEPASVMEEVKSLVGAKLIYHKLATEANHVTFHLEDDESVCKSLRDLSKRFSMPGSNTRHTITVDTTTSPGSALPPEDVDEIVKRVLASRYNPDLKKLDLSKFHSDQGFRSYNVVFVLCHASNLDTVANMIVKNIPEVEEIDLSNNKIMKLDTTARILRGCRNLHKLNLNNNRFYSLSDLRALRRHPYTDLYLENNKFSRRYKNADVYISEVRTYFPKLLVLDGKELPKPIGFEVDENDDVVPPFRPSFFCNDQAKQIVVMFLKQYYEVFDSKDRSPLAAAYCEDAIFSMTTLLPDSGPRAVPIDSKNIPNRNLRIRTRPDEQLELLLIGRSAVMKQINNLPPCTHDLHNFVVDVSIATARLIKVVLHGVYCRHNIRSKWANIRSFQRTLIIVPVGGGYCIANEQIYLCLPTYNQLQKSFKFESQLTAAAVPSSGPSTAEPIPQPSQLLMIEGFAEQSHMKPEYAKLCLEQNEWDFAKSAALFMKLKEEGKIPDNYYNH